MVLHLELDRVWLDWPLALAPSTLVLTAMTLFAHVALVATDNLGVLFASSCHAAS